MMAFFEAIDSQLLIIILVGAGIILVLLGLAVAVAKIMRSNRELSRKNSAAQDAVANAVDNAFVELSKDYLVMPKNTTYRVGNDGEIAAGTYSLKATTCAHDKTFNLRFNDLVEHYTDGDLITLAEGDTICPVSTTLLLKPLDADTLKNQK